MGLAPSTQKLQTYQKQEYIQNEKYDKQTFTYHLDLPFTLIEIFSDSPN